MSERALGEFVQLQRGNTYKSSLLGLPGPKLLGLGSIQRNGGFKGDNLKTYGGETDPRIMLLPGDIYVSLKDVAQSADLLGAVARVPPEVEIGRLTQDTVKLEFKDGAPASLIYWVLRSPQYRNFCRSFATGTTNLGLPREDFLAFPIPAETQARLRVVDTLDALDHKIELNRRMNETLEAMARAIFKDWFVDFGPTRAKMAGQNPYLAPDLWSLFPARLDDDGKPEGWATGTLGDAAQQTGESVSPETLDPDTPYIGLEHMPRRSITLSDWEGAGKATSGKLAFRKGHFLFGKLRPYFHKVGIAPVDGICSTDIVVLNARQPNAAAFVLACISRDEFVAFTDRTSDGTKMPRTSWGRMAKYDLCLPSDTVLDAFNAVVQPMVDRIVTNIHESRTLAATRDLLLPKLMSGEVRVKEAERFTQGAA